MDDLWLDEDTFIQKLTEFDLRERVLSRSERTVLKNNKPAEQVDRILNDLEEFYKWFAASFKNFQGFVAWGNFANFLRNL